jgi:hypothetical protein
MDIVILTAGVASTAPSAQTLDPGHSATFLFGQITTLLISRYTDHQYNNNYVNNCPT